MSFENIVQLLVGVHPYKSNLPSIENSVRAQCPCCGGSSTKLNVSLTVNGTVLINCFGGCTFPQIINALSLDVSEYYPPKTSHSNHSQKNKTIKGWDWWSMASALDNAHFVLMNDFIELTTHLPIDAPARLIMARAAGKIKELAQMIKYGKKGGENDNVN